MAVAADETRFNGVLKEINETFLLEEKEYSLAISQFPEDPKSPVFLKMVFSNGHEREIGIVHLVDLMDPDLETTGYSKWDKAPYEVLARSVDSLRKAVLQRVTLFSSAALQGEFIHSEGTIIRFCKGVHLLENGIFMIDGRLIKKRDENWLTIESIHSEGIIECVRLENGHVELKDTADHRSGKGIFIDTSSGTVYRA